jgi:preprotein translocase subunit SecD
MKHIVKLFVTFLAISLLASACSRKTESSVPAASTNKPKFTIAASDLAVPADLGTNGVGSGHESIVVHLQLSASKTEAFRNFTHDHINQQTQLVVGSKVVAEPFVMSEITNGQADLSFSSADEARTVADLLSKK